MLTNKPTYYYSIIRKKFSNSYFAEDERQVIIGIDCEYFDSNEYSYDSLKKIYNSFIKQKKLSPFAGLFGTFAYESIHFFEKIGKIEIQRYEEIAKILTNEQLEEYNSYINSKKQSFNEKIDRIKKLEDNVSLSNEQKAKVLKFERDFKRNVEKLKNDRLSVEMFTQKYEELKQKRNEQIRSVLTDEQSKYFSEN